MNVKLLLLILLLIIISILLVVIYYKNKNEHFKNKEKITILMPSIQRDRTNYINDTLESLLNNKSNESVLDIYIHIGDFNKTSNDSSYDMSNYINDKFTDKIHILETRMPEYGNLLTDDIVNTAFEEDTGVNGKMKSKNYEKDKKFQYWKMKQNLDYYFGIQKLAKYTDPEYVLFLEDDQMAVKNWDKIVLDGIHSCKNKNDSKMTNLKFSPHGMCAWLYPMNHLMKYSNYMRNNYTKAPCDILIYEYRNKNGYNEQKHTEYAFEHEGEESSFIHRIQTLKVFKKNLHENFENRNNSSNMIPKVIYMCCKDKKNIPTKVKQNWHDLNPNYKIELYDDKECHDYLLKEFGKEYGDFYNEIPFGPIKADLWRLCILYKNGGVYSDIDIHPLQSIDNIIANDSVTFCSVLSTFKNNIFQAFIYTTKGNTILKKCIDYMFEKRKLIQNTKNIGNPRGGFYWKISGTHDMYRTLKEELNVNNIESKIYKTSKQTIKILDEYTPGKTTKDCKVRFNGTDLLKSRYSDYKMYEHSF